MFQWKYLGFNLSLNYQDIKNLIWAGMHSSKKINDGWLWWYLSQRMPTQLNGGKVKHLPSLELASFAAIATYQLAFAYLKRKIPHYI